MLESLKQNDFSQRFSAHLQSEGQTVVECILCECNQSGHTLVRALNPKQAGGGGGIRPQAGSSLCCAETVSSRKLKFCDFYYILITFHFEFKPVPWDIHCCHVNGIVEECLV